MFITLSFLVAGIPIGYALRHISKFHELVDKGLTWSVRLLLFFLGLAIGADPSIMNNLDTLGLQGAFIALLSTLGSILCTRLLEPSIKKSLSRVQEKKSREAQS